MKLHLFASLFALGVTAASSAGIESRQQAQSAAAAFDPVDQSIEDLQQAMQEGRVTSRGLVEAYFARIAAYDREGPALNAVMTVNPQAREAAEALDAERANRGPRGPLHGIPILVKDNYETIEMPTTAGSIALATFHPRRDGVQVQRLKAAGAVILGKTSMHELAAGIVTVGSGFGQTRNPYDLDRNPGGSSGGTGAAIAANFAAAGMGSDTCGSIRNPASHNNLVGLRGTQGLSSRTGIVPLSSTQDIGGPIARSVEDLAILLDATVGPDPADPSTAVAAGKVPPSYRAALREDALKGARIGVVRSLFGSAPEDREVAAIVDRALETWKKAGADVNDVVIPGLEDLLRDSSMIAADFKFDLADYLARDPDAPVKSLGEILDRGLYHSALEATFRARNAVEQRESESSRRARIKQGALRQAVDAVLNEHRLAALVYPTLRRRPARLGEAQAGSTCGLSAHSGLPALAVPAGFTADGVPVGVDLLGSAWSEPTLLSLGYASQRTLKPRRLPFSTPRLVGGRAPGPERIAVELAAGGGPSGQALRALLDATYDRTTSRLHFELKADADTLGRIQAVWIHASTPEKPGAARHRLFAPGLPPSGTVVLTFADREALAEGRLLARLFVTGVRGSAADVPLVPSSRAAPAVIAGLDHIPIAVSDLDRAARRYRELGFALKPGRPHPNGIRNEHVKFRDGTELELITAPEARDELTAEYRRHLEAGEGPAFLALFAPSLDRLAARLDASTAGYRRNPGYISLQDDHPLDYLFFGGRNSSPTDRPEHFAHANGAESLVAVWLAGDDLSEERALLRGLGATVAREEVRVPDVLTAEVARVEHGAVLLLPGARQLVPGRRIVGATVRVASLERARRALGGAAPAAASASSIFLAPTITHGLWLELREGK